LPIPQQPFYLAEKDSECLLESKMNTLPDMALQLEALQTKVDIMNAKLDLLFDKEIGNHFAWEIVDNKVVIKGHRNLAQEKKEAQHACLAAAGLL